MQTDWEKYLQFLSILRFCTVALQSSLEPSGPSSNKLRGPKRAKHDVVICGDVRDCQFFVDHQYVFQRKCAAVREFASTPGGQRGVRRWVPRRSRQGPPALEGLARVEVARFDSAECLAPGLLSLEGRALGSPGVALLGGTDGAGQPWATRSTI